MANFPANYGLGFTADPMLEMVKGRAKGHICINKFGENPANASATEEDIWDGGGTYPFPTTALITSISQTTNQVAMLGATIEVQGLNASWEIVTQDAVLNGTDTTTVVTLTTPLIRVFRAKVQANVIGDSDIRVHNAAETVDYAVIQAGNNQTSMAIYTVPAGKTAYMTNYYCDFVEVTNQDPMSVDFNLFSADKLNNYEFQLKHEKAITKGAAGFQHFFLPYLVFTERTDIKLTALPADKQAHVHAGFDLILVDN